MFTSVNNGICTHCLAQQRQNKQRHRTTAALARNQLSVNQLSVLDLFKFKAMSLNPIPKQSETSFSEMDDGTLYQIFNYALATVHRTNNHGTRGSFRRLTSNKKTLDKLSIIASKLNIIGCTHSNETGGQQLFRMYHYMTLPTTWKRICTVMDENGIVNWSALR